MENELFDFMMSNSSFLFNLIVFFYSNEIFLSFHSFGKSLGFFVEKTSPCFLFINRIFDYITN